MKLRLSVSLKQSGIKNLISLMLISISPVLATEITVLPSYIYGNNRPPYLEKADSGIAIGELISYFAADEFQIDVTDFRLVKDFVQSENVTAERSLTKPIVSRICHKFDSDYVVKSDIDSQNELSINTEIYNCRSQTKKTYDATLTRNFNQELERHVTNFLNFLPRKSFQSLEPPAQNFQEVIVVLDQSGSFSSEGKQALEFLKRTLEEKEIAVGLFSMQKEKTFFIKPELKNKKIESVINLQKFGGRLSPDELSESLLKLSAELKNEGQNNKIKKIIILTDCILNRENSSYENAISSLKSKGYSVNIVTGSYFSLQSMANHKKAARRSGNELIQLTHTQRIGTSEGYKYLKLKDYRLSVSESAMLGTDQNLKNGQQIDPGKMHLIADFPHPQNMAGLYEKIFSKKIIEKTAVKSDIDAILESIIFGSTVSAEKSGKRVLIKSDGISMWIDFRKVDEKYLDQEIFIETVFVRDKRNSSGYRSIPEKTRIYKGKAPALLILNPKEIARNLNDDNIPMVKCFVKGRILEIK